MRRGLPRPAAALALALLLACLVAQAHGHVRETGYKVCPSMDIRNYPEFLMRLRNCTVIEGRLSIVLMERASQRSFENMSFPELREVTGYIKIYRMRGLRSLGDLFPNLAVIRGMTLFRDYSLVIYDNENLQSLGLRSLVKVERGSVRIERNDKLCYVDTIDWSRIVTGGIENSIFRNNYDRRLCGLCPYSDSRIEDRHSSHRQCPADASGRLLCWSDRDCQKFCPVSCGDRACMDDGTCCHPACLGGCDGPHRQDCHVCRHFSLNNGLNRTCVEKCPDNTYQLLKRCVSELECRSMTPPSDVTGAASRSYKTFQRTCIYICPSGYMEYGDPPDSTCRPCPPGGCQRECPGGSIDTIVSAQQFRGCTVIKGMLEISLRASGGRTMEELEESLGEVREIEGFLKVIRSHSLVSLSFLKKLRKIGGKDSSGMTNGKKQSLHIFNNPNLELLWNWTRHGDIEISQGKLFIHFNPKLCYKLIEPLKHMTKDPESTFDELEVSEENNGDQASCYSETLNLSVSMLHRTVVLLTWNKHCIDDSRKLLGYSIYYIMAEHNITQYERRDACYDSWNVQDITDEDTQNETTAIVDKKGILASHNCSNKQPMFWLLTKLTAYTRYAAYVKTYTTLQDKSGAQSPIIYFKTLPGKPSPPINPLVESPEPHAVTVKWSPPTTPNGILNMYHVQVQAHSYNRPEITRRSYCDNPSSFHNMITMKETETVDKKKYLPKAKEDDTCTCEDDESAFGTRFTTQVEAAAESIDFENALQNEVYIKQERARGSGRGGRSKRSSADRTLVIVSNYTNPSLKEKPPNSTDDDGYIRTAYYELSGSTLLLKLTNLRHFTWYTVSVWACRQKDENETQDKYEEFWCSNRAHETFRTSELVNADVVTKVRAEIIAPNKTQPEVNVTWEPPRNPNGFIVAYDVHHAIVNPSSQTPDVGLHSCLSAESYESVNRGYMLRNLAPGNYSIKVTPVSMSGFGNVSAEVFVFIPERNAETGYDWVWGLIGGCLVILLVVGGGVWYARRGLILDNGANKLFASVNPEYISTVYVPDEWEVPRSSVEFVRELGQGSFGMVYEGLAKNIIKGVPETRCAVKTVNEHATDKERIEFLNEASVMKAFDTHHVVRLLGVVSRGQPTLVVMELMEQGDLKSYLRSHRPDAEGSVPRDRDQPPPQPPSLQRITQMAIEIADGMAYLSAKKFVHRDLAARNCMVAGDLTVKVGDFGMTRDIYETDYYRKGSKGLLPVRWMSPESLKDGVFSSNSDVWSFGVVLWEMVTLAMLPYQGLSNEQVLRYVVEGGVMERPEHCPDRMYELMRACWLHRPAQRPTFLHLVSELATSAAPSFRQRSFFHTPQGQELYTQQRANVDEEQEQMDLNVGAVATGSGSNLFGVSGRLASWVRELSSLRSRASSDDAAAEPLAPAGPRAIPLKATSTPGPNGVLRDPAATGC